MIGEQIQLNSDGTLGVTCKIPGEWLPLLNAICDMKGTNINNLLKMCLQFLIETAKITTDASPDMKVLLHMMRVDANWQEMFKYVEKSNLDIAQVILVLQQNKGGQPREGFSLGMFNKPFMGDCQQTLCVDTIMERVIEVAMGFSRYWDLRKIAKHFEAETLREALIRMVDAQTILNLEEADQDELPGIGDVAPNGKSVAFGNTPKRRQKRTPDSLANDQRFKFDDIEHDAPAPELEDWEGEHVNRDLNKELSLGFVEDD